MKLICVCVCVCERDIEDWAQIFKCFVIELFSETPYIFISWQGLTKIPWQAFNLESSFE